MKARADADEREAEDNLAAATSRNQTRLSGLKMDLKIAKDKGQPSKNLQDPYAVPADYLFLRGNVLLRMNRANDARQAYRRAVKADPCHANAWNNLVALGLGSKDSAGAKADLAEAEAQGVIIRPELKKAVLATP